MTDPIESGPGAPPPRWPITPQQLIGWITAYTETLRSDPPGAQALLDQFAQVRAMAKATAGVEEWLLLVCREHNVRLQDLAEIIAGHPNRDQRRNYVTGPRDRIKRLQRDYHNAHGRQAALLHGLTRLDTPDPGDHATASETGPHASKQGEQNAGVQELQEPQEGSAMTTSTTTEPCEHVTQMQLLTARSTSRLRRGNSPASLESLVELGHELTEKCRQECGEQSPYREDQALTQQ